MYASLERAWTSSCALSCPLGASRPEHSVCARRVWAERPWERGVRADLPLTGERGVRTYHPFTFELFGPAEASTASPETWTGGSCKPPVHNGDHLMTRFRFLPVPCGSLFSTLLKYYSGSLGYDIRRPVNCFLLYILPWASLPLADHPETVTAKTAGWSVRG